MREAGRKEKSVGCYPLIVPSSREVGAFGTIPSYIMRERPYLKQTLVLQVWFSSVVESLYSMYAAYKFDSQHFRNKTNPLLKSPASLLTRKTLSI